MSEVARIAAAWERAGRPYCDHSRKEREYDLGADTGDWACLGCGVTWARGSEPPPPAGEPPAAN